MPDTLPSLQSLSNDLENLARAASRSVVAIRSGRSHSSGFVWQPGLVVTAAEALAEEGEIEVTLPGGTMPKAALAGRDPSTDVAVLRLETADLPPVVLEPVPVSPGGIAMVVGSQDGDTLAGLGIVSLAGPSWRSLRGGEIDARIELDLSLRRRAEGGLAIDAEGRAFGMAVFGPRRRVLVIPAATIERVAQRLRTHGRIARGYLGLALQPVRLEEGGNGAMVMSVDRAGPGAAAGMAQGDVIVAWDARPVDSIRGLLRALGPDSVGMTAVLSLKRAGAPAEAKVTIGERPQH